MLDLICWFLGDFVLAVTLPFAQVLILVVFCLVIDDVFEDVVLCIRIRRLDVRRVVGSLVLGIVVVVFEHVGGENGVSSVSWKVHF